MLHKIKCNANYAFMEQDYVALLAMGSGPSQLTLTGDTCCIPKHCFPNSLDPDAPLCNTYNMFGNFTTYMSP